MKQQEIFFVAAEPSADMHSALLATELLRRGNYCLTGAGGQLMRQAGVDLDLYSMSWATIGWRTSLIWFPAALRAAARILVRLRRRRPALLLLVDFGGFNISLARYARIRFPWLPILYYFPPRSWDKSERDRSALARLADTVVTPFPWSEELLRADGVNAHFVGHPVMDRVQPCGDRDALRRELGIPPAKRYVGFMAGSRRLERKLLGPQMLGAAQRLIGENGYHFLWSPGPPGTVDRLQIPPDLQRHTTVIPRSTDLLRASDLVVTCFGTATLEAAAAQTPMIAAYRATFLDTLFFMALRPRLTTRYYTMPNIILGYEAIPELIRSACNADALAIAIRNMFEDPEAMPRMREALGRIREQLEKSGSIARTADLVEQTIAMGRGNT